MGRIEELLWRRSFEFPAHRMKKTPMMVVKRRRFWLVFWECGFRNSTGLSLVIDVCLQLITIASSQIPALTSLRASLISFSAVNPSCWNNVVELSSVDIFVVEWELGFLVRRIYSCGLCPQVQQLKISRESVQLYFATNLTELDWRKRCKKGNRRMQRPICSEELVTRVLNSCYTWAVAASGSAAFISRLIFITSPLAKPSCEGPSLREIAVL